VTQIVLDLRRSIQPPERKRLDAWREYERRKEQWAAAHPNASHIEYAAAMRSLADELGV
jgi:hypothetical protein